MLIINGLVLNEPSHMTMIWLNLFKPSTSKWKWHQKRLSPDWSCTCNSF